MDQCYQHVHNMQEQKTRLHKGLRGHRETESDDTKLYFVNMGNFLEIIKLVRLENETAKNNLDNLPQNAT